MHREMGQPGLAESLLSEELGEARNSLSVSMNW